MSTLKCPPFKPPPTYVPLWLTWRDAPPTTVRPSLIHPCIAMPRPWHAHPPLCLSTKWTIQMTCFIQLEARIFRSGFRFGPEGNYGIVTLLFRLPYGIANPISVLASSLRFGRRVPKTNDDLLFGPCTFWTIGFLVSIWDRRFQNK